MRISDFKKPALSGIVFFGTVLALSVGYGAYSSISSSEYAAGQPLSSSLFGKVVGNLEDLNAKVLNLSFSGGNVGIGTTSPGSQLHVEGSSGGDPRVSSRYFNGDTNAIAGFQAMSTTGIGGFILATAKGTYKHLTTATDGDTYLTSRQAGNNLIFGTVSAERMRIDASGNVGIGTTSPVDRLHIKGDVSIEKSNGASRCRLTTYVSACSDGYASLGCTGGKCLCYYCY